MRQHIYKWKKKKLFFLRRLRCLNYWKIEFSFDPKLQRGKSSPKITNFWLRSPGHSGRWKRVSSSRTEWYGRGQHWGIRIGHKTVRRHTMSRNRNRIPPRRSWLVRSLLIRTLGIHIGTIARVPTVVLRKTFFFSPVPKVCNTELGSSSKKSY